MHPNLKSMMSVVGWDHQVPAIVAAIFVYVTVLFVCWLVYKCNQIFLPKSIQEYAQDFIKTLTYCTFPFGHGIVRQYYGSLGYIFFAVPILTLTQFALPLGDASPIGSWGKLIKRQISPLKFVMKCGVQILAGLSAFRLGIAIYHFDLHEFYAGRVLNFNKGVCSSGLNAELYLGVLAEMCGVCVDSIVRSYRLAKHEHLDALLKFYVTCTIVCIGFSLTGMFMNPAMATGLTFGCGTTGLLAHTLVYWIGPFMGLYVSKIIIARLHNGKAKKRE